MPPGVNAHEPLGTSCDPTYEQSTFSMATTKTESTCGPSCSMARAVQDCILLPDSLYLCWKSLVMCPKLRLQCSVATAMGTIAHVKKDRESVFMPSVHVLQMNMRAGPVECTYVCAFCILCSRGCDMLISLSDYACNSSLFCR